MHCLFWWIKQDGKIIQYEPVAQQVEEAKQRYDPSFWWVFVRFVAGMKHLLEGRI